MISKALSRTGSAIAVLSSGHVHSAYGKWGTMVQHQVQAMVIDPSLGYYSLPPKFELPLDLELSSTGAAAMLDLFSAEWNDLRNLVLTNDLAMRASSPGRVSDASAVFHHAFAGAPDSARYRHVKIVFAYALIAFSDWAFAGPRLGLAILDRVKASVSVRDFLECLEPATPAIHRTSLAKYYLGLMLVPDAIYGDAQMAFDAWKGVKDTSFSDIQAYSIVMAASIDMDFGTVQRFSIVSSTLEKSVISGTRKDVFAVREICEPGEEVVILPAVLLIGATTCVYNTNYSLVRLCEAVRSVHCI